MHAIAQQLDETLNELNPSQATRLTELVRAAIAKSQVKQKNDPWAGVERDEKGYPRGYFETTAGCFEGEPFEAPDDPPPQQRESW